MTSSVQSLAPAHNDEVRVCLSNANKSSSKVHTFLMPRNATIVDLHKAVRSQLKIKTSTPLALAVNEYSPSSNATIGDICDICDECDGELHVQYIIEKNMGAGAVCGFGMQTDPPPTIIQTS